MKLKYIFFALRPKTLSAAILPVLAVAAYVYPANLKLCGFALLSALCIQIASNLFNDAIDHKKGVDNEDRLGPLRATQMQWLSAKQVYILASIFCIAAVILAIPLIQAGGMPILFLGLVSLSLAYLYTGGPYPLAYYGLGDVFVFLFFGLGATKGTYFLYHHDFSLDIFVLACQCGFLCTVLIAINNLRDIDGDKKANKRTLAVLLGKSFVRREILFLYTAAFLLQIYWFYTSKSAFYLLPFLLVIPAFSLIKEIMLNPPSKIYNRYLAKSSGIYIAFIILQSGAFLCT